MSGIAKKWVEAAKNGIEGVAGIVGPALGRAASEVGAEAKRLGTQGTMEVSSGLFSGQSNAFVPYGPGQYTPSAQNQQKQEQEHGHER